MRLTYLGRVWLAILIGCVVFWWFVIASVIRLAKWAGVL